jgi:hypothetical protein
LLEWLNQELTWLLGNATALGADSWLEALTWVAAIAAVFYAAASLRHQSLQSKATLLLALYERWEHLSEQRKMVVALNKSVHAIVLRKHAHLKAQYQEDCLRKCFLETLEKDEKDVAKFAAFIAHLSFFETVGIYVRRGYNVTLSDQKNYPNSALAVSIQPLGLSGTADRL